MGEALHEELARLVGEYRNPAHGIPRDEAWNMLADFAETNADQICAALSSFANRGPTLLPRLSSLLRHVPEWPPLCVSEISSRTGVGTPECGADLQALVRKELVARHGSTPRVRYTITPIGKAALSGGSAHD